GQDELEAEHELNEGSGGKGSIAAEGKPELASGIPHISVLSEDSIDDGAGAAAEKSEKLGQALFLRRGATRTQPSPPAPERPTPCGHTPHSCGRASREAPPLAFLLRLSPARRRPRLSSPRLSVIAKRHVDRHANINKRHRRRHTRHKNPDIVN